MLTVDSLGVFAAIQAMRRGGKPVETIADLAGLARTSPKLAFGLSRKPIVCPLTTVRFWSPMIKAVL